jgi:hypothetical protein
MGGPTSSGIRASKISLGGKGYQIVESDTTRKPKRVYFVRN